jgi:hypothetical protein
MHDPNMARFFQAVFDWGIGLLVVGAFVFLLLRVAYEWLKKKGR